MDMDVDNWLYKEDAKINEYHYEESIEDDSKKYDNIENNIEIASIKCKNIGPSLAKIMSIIIKEEPKTYWKLRKNNNLDNSKETIQPCYFTSKNNSKNVNNYSNNINYFQTIKNDIINLKTLSQDQLEYIKRLNKDENYEIIQIYNTVLEFMIKTHTI